MGDKKIVTDIPDLRRNPEHISNMANLVPLTEKLFGEVSRIEAIGRNQTYQVTLADNRIIKITYTGNAGDYHQMLFDAGIRVPKILKLIKKDSQFAWKFTDWIDGICWYRSINSGDVYKEIDPKYYHKLGELAAKISNCRMPDGRPFEMTDLLWTNFVVDKNDEVWLIDSKTVNPCYVPENWILYRIFFHFHTLAEQKKAFIEGYVATVEKREPYLTGLVDMGLEFLERTHEKLA